MESARNPSNNLPGVPRIVAAVALAATILFSAEVYQKIDDSSVTGCPATADTYDPVSWVAAPFANGLDGADRISDEVIARQCSGK